MNGVRGVGRVALAAIVLSGAMLAGAAYAATDVADTEEVADTDEAGIRQAVLNYANSAYDVRPDLIDESVHPTLQKIGLVAARDGSGYRTRWMNFYELKDLVSGWNAEGRFDPESAKREIAILDRLDKTAVARLDAEWGVDFFHLAKLEGEWVIMNVIWQTYPAKSE